MNYYAHSISKFDKFDFNDIIVLQKILSTGYVLSRRNLDLCEEDALFNGMDYISLCDLSAHHEDYSAYNIYVKNGLSLLFDKNIKVIKPVYINLDKRDLNIGEKMHEFGLKGIYTDLSDEVTIATTRVTLTPDTKNANLIKTINSYLGGDIMTRGSNLARQEEYDKF